MEISGAGDFLSQEFLHCIRAKVGMIVDSILKNEGSWIVWTDIDILLFPPLLTRLDSIIASAEDEVLYFQREARTGQEVNTGFILIKCGTQTEAFFREAGSRLAKELSKNEQAIENEMLREGHAPPWGLLPEEFVARTHGWPPRRPMAIYHANYTLGPDGIGQKIRQFKQVRAMEKWGAPAVFVMILRRVWEKFTQNLKAKK